MSFYAFVAFAGNGVAGLFGGWTEMNPALQWRWIQWISFMFVFYISERWYINGCLFIFLS